MDSRSIEQGRQRLVSSEVPVDPDTLPRLVAFVERFIATGEADSFHFYPEGDYRVLAELLGVSVVDGKQIQHLFYLNTVHGYDAVEDASPELSGRIPLDVALTVIADEQASFEEFPNDFKSGVLIEIDEVTMVAFGMELDEQPRVCEGCAAEDDEYADHDRSCEHMDDTYSVSYWAALLRPDEVSDINWDNGTLG